MTNAIIRSRLFKKLIWPISQAIVRSIVVGKWSRTILNCWYCWLGWRVWSAFHAGFAKIFRNRTDVHLAAGNWAIYFAGRKILLPLRPLWSWLDWDTALSILGHDVEVKRTYVALINSPERPALFLDIGANYGTHSLLFLSAGVPTMAFEPNPTCFSYFETVCQQNGLEGKGRWEQVAIGDRTGSVELVFPEGDTWLGTINSEVTESLKNSYNVVTEHVPLRRIDDYLSEFPREKILVKIDVEGFESQVIKGASQFLTHHKPKIIFECNHGELRAEFFELLASYGYSIYPLPWNPSVGSVPLGVEEFSASTATNFIASP
jgi:FkbM family methyltransferase